MRTCLTCADTACADRGTSQGACDDWTSDISGEDAEVVVPDVLAGIQAKVDSLEAQFQSFQRAAADFVRALQEG